MTINIEVFSNFSSLKNVQIDSEVNEIYAHSIFYIIHIFFKEMFNKNI